MSRTIQTPTTSSEASSTTAAGRLHRRPDGARPGRGVYLRDLIAPGGQDATP